MSADARDALRVSHMRLQQRCHDAEAHVERLLAEIEWLRDRAVCSGCGGDVAESGACIAGCGEGEMIPASGLPGALRAMREQRDAMIEWIEYE